MLIDIGKIEVGERLRSRLDPVKLRELADDMERNGQLQEIVAAVEYDENARSTTVKRARLIAGYRRLEAAKLLGWTQIRCTRQLEGDIDVNSEIDLLRAEYSENELRENFTEMERVAFGVKIKERIAAAARERMLAGKKPDYEYDPETGYKVWNTNADDIADTDETTNTDPPQNLVEGIGEVKQDYFGGEVNDFISQRIGMSKEKFRQGEYVLKHGTKEQHAAIDRGENSIFGVYNEIKPKPAPPPSPPLREQPPPKTPTFTVKNTAKLPTPEERIAELQSQLETERSRAVAAENEVKRLETALAAANARIKELEAKYESD